ncbi:hypothetical protein ASG90_17720 [Nocardioides sp. Soil797]|nr:hypothetical protein ASG90_17720 [Nocardioides sp. Soil797]
MARATLETRQRLRFGSSMTMPSRGARTRSGERPASRSWSASPALVRAALGSAAGLTLAVVLGEPDLVVLVSPLAAYAALALLRRPHLTPRADTRVDHRLLVEGEGTTWRLALTDADDVEHLTRIVEHTRFLVSDPPHGAVGGLVRGVPNNGAPGGGAPGKTAPGDTETGDNESGKDRVGDLPISPRRWGLHDLGDQVIVGSSAWAGFRWRPTPPPSGGRLTVLPEPSPFDADAELPQPDGLVGAHRSRRIGDGSEFSGIRVFGAGDRLRRINWRVSLRTDELHVDTMRAEQDSGVLLVIDAFADHGRSGGVDGSPSSLDLTVRAAAALAEHHLRTGDRVGLRVMNGGNLVVGYGAGIHHLVRIRSALAQVRPSTPREGSSDRLRFPCPPGTVVFVLSPMLHQTSVNATATLASRGLPLTLIDTLPAGIDVAGGSDHRDLHDLAWRMRLLERDALLRQLSRVGCPVVPWRGPGTIDDVMRRLSRRAALPRELSR